MNTNQTYTTYRNLFRNQRLPLAFVDLEKFDANIAYVAQLARAAGKTIRLGSKSIRCVELMRRIFAAAPDIYRGILTFTVEETAWLAAQGFDDLIVAYPSVQPSDIGLMVEMTRAGKQAWLMVDNIEHLRILSAAGVDSNLTLHACLEDSTVYCGATGKIHPSKGWIFADEKALRGSLAGQGLLDFLFEFDDA